MKLSNAWVRLGASASVFFMTSNAFAAGDLNTAITGVSTGLGSASKVIQLGAYAGGGATLVSGFLKLRDHAANPQTNLGVGVGRCFAGACMIGMPTVAGAILNTTGNGSAGSVTTYANF